MQRAAYSVKELQAEQRMREEIKRCKQETKATVEATAAQRLAVVEEKAEEKRRAHEEKLERAWRRKLEHANDDIRLEMDRADNLQRELDHERAQLYAVRVEIDRLKKEKAESLRDASAKAVSDRNAAIAFEQHRAEMILQVSCRSIASPHHPSHTTAGLTRSSLTTSRAALLTPPPHTQTPPPHNTPPPPLPHGYAAFSHALIALTPTFSPLSPLSPRASSHTEPTRQ